MPPLANSSVGSDGLHTPWQFGPRSSLLSRVPEPLLPCMQLYIVFSSWLEYILFLPLSVSKFLGPLYKEHQGIQPDLSGADLRRLLLLHADFSRANLSKVDFR